MAAFNDFLRQQAKVLPQLPVPSLQQTIHCYLRSIKPFVTEEEFNISKAIATKFSAPGCVGDKLQNLLIQKANKTDNWLADWWLNMAYLSCRSPLPVYSSTSMVYPKQTFSCKQEQLKFAAALTAGALDFLLLLSQNKIPADKIGPIELDMSQFSRVFSVCRIPGEFVDNIRLPDLTKLSRYIIVIHNNHFFAVPVFGKEGEVLNQNQLLAQMEDIVAQSPYPASAPIGILTSENRTVWSKAREALIQADKQNEISLDIIEQGLFVICLDGPPSVIEQTAPDFLNAAALKLTHGGGSKYNSANRWFDHVAQFVIGLNGEAGLSFEHSPGEAHPIITDHMETYWKKFGGKADPVKPAGYFSSPQKLNFSVPDHVRDTILEAQKNMDKLVENIEIRCFLFPHYGKEFIKSLKIGSPDSYIQMAIQLAFYKIYNKPGAQYESATTRKFLYGRTETIRSCSTEAVQFACTMLDSSATNDDKAKALLAAMKFHREYVINAVQGQGVDRHLMGLRLIAMENGIEVPDFYTDIGYTRSCYMRLSTSQVPSISNSCGLFGPLVPDGYGCCYNPRAQEILFGTSAFNSCPDTSAVKFCNLLQESLIEMKLVLSHSTLQAKI